MTDEECAEQLAIAWLRDVIHADENGPGRTE